MGGDAKEVDDLCIKKIMDYIKETEDM